MGLETSGLDPADPRFDSHEGRCGEGRLELMRVLEEAFAKHPADHWRQAFLDRQYPEAGAALNAFTGFVSHASLVEQEELFTRSFDVQAVTTLDLGYVLFGDDYKRGALLVNLNREHREAGNPCHNELADHLPNVLRLLPKLQDAALRDELVDRDRCGIAGAIRFVVDEDFHSRKEEV